ncbi:SDR family NAD(P)-dependent oxidoreductase [bacterium M00.F.Ca.ET.228.01.1.1]|uniref:oxidoreductase n=1 Tax=Paraburkholderia phenoliruptrix TaxID=252970 RepID=UPI00109263A3|nr:oxidoreductase [Paraburkholderia phenoliruptrix]TGP45801.1 SDR family NAD(P)-dependent oxidoreductase [bacterium M00.F.Ca.ET.228.01.1.1]TGS04287.1 SDR family NAD(P)-dependent oxidoreductase [bacterium M00.F.Ca.ET.191.01.1.1]TGU07094.1 SDR family NAD(P)-dependent oxidoreductase [bacterium M00.F.Ca.ET.155.01.1.1]MBW0448486.1 SDR family NAD(P)-dependent oxidoreductase [Paraburkholderia phenoliruptrix]MBW9100652.1 SDR family NAD(P)-dependent oxidoreductase [Paraburkholderia phenoliruptrix]
MTRDKVWFITGCSGGLGRTLAEAVLASGQRLTATARDTKRLQPLVDTYGDRVRVVALDVTDPVAARDAVSLAVGQFGRLDVLVNNAGYADLASIEDVTDQALREQMDVNFFGVCNLSRAALPVMRKQRAGHIMQISSVGGRVGGPGLAAYQAAKWAVGGFSEVLAKEVRDFGIKVTVIEPGSMRTNWAGSSMTIPQISEAYKAVIGPVAERLRRSDGNQPGDPARVAQVIMDIAEVPAPPLRLLVGSDAVAVAANAARFRAEEDAQWREVSESVAFPTTDTPHVAQDPHARGAG